MKKILVPLTTAGLFAALSFYCYPRYTPQHTATKLARHASDAGTTYRTPPDCGLDFLCLKTWAEGKPLKDATGEDMAALIERSVADAKRHHILSASDEQAALRFLWGDGE